MTKWEYKVTNRSGYNYTLEKFLNILGQDGWEIVNIEGLNEFSNIVFKRPITESDPIKEISNNGFYAAYESI